MPRDPSPLSLFTIHYSLLTTHYSLLTIHYSLLMAAFIPVKVTVLSCDLSAFCLIPQPFGGARAEHQGCRVLESLDFMEIAKSLMIAWYEP